MLLARPGPRGIHAVCPRFRGVGAMSTSWKVRCESTQITGSETETPVLSEKMGDSSARRPASIAQITRDPFPLAQQTLAITRNPAHPHCLSWRKREQLRLDGGEGSGEGGAPRLRASAGSPPASAQTSPPPPSSIPAPLPRPQHQNNKFDLIHTVCLTPNSGRETQNSKSARLVVPYAPQLDLGG